MIWEFFGRRVVGQACAASIYYEVDRVNKSSEEYPISFGGSGWIYRHVSGKNYVVTAGHVLKSEHRLQASNLWVQSNSGRWYRAVFEAADDQSDIGIARIHGQLCDYLGLSRSDISFDPVEYQQHVICTANTSHADKFVTITGLVVHPRQSFSIAYPDQRFGFIQVAMATLPGMSGAPLLDSSHKLRGMVTKKYSDFGLAIPSNVLMAKVDELIATGHCKRKTLGISFSKTPCLFPLQGSFVLGLEIMSIDSDSLASEGGLKVGDVIVRINGQACMSPCDVVEFTENSMKTILIEYLRNGILVQSALNA